MVTLNGSLLSVWDVLLIVLWWRLWFCGLLLSELSGQEQLGLWASSQDSALELIHLLETLSLAFRSQFLPWKQTPIYSFDVAKHVVVFLSGFRWVVERVGGSDYFYGEFSCAGGRRRSEGGNSGGIEGGHDTCRKKCECTRSCSGGCNIARLTAFWGGGSKDFVSNDIGNHLSGLPHRKTLTGSC